MFVYGGLPSQCINGSFEVTVEFSSNFVMIFTDDSYTNSNLCNTNVRFSQSSEYSVYFNSRAICDRGFPVIASEYSENYYVTFYSPDGPTNRDGAGCSATALSCLACSNFTIDYFGGTRNCTSKQAVLSALLCNSFSFNYQERENCEATDTYSSAPARVTAHRSGAFVIRYGGDRQLMCRGHEAVSVTSSTGFGIFYHVSQDSCSSVSAANNTSRVVNYSCRLWKNDVLMSDRLFYHPPCDAPAPVSLPYSKFYDLSVKNGFCPRDQYLRTNVRLSSNFEVHYYLDGSSPAAPFDECKARVHNCTSRQKCNNLLNGYYCSCKPGFYPSSSTSCRRLPCPKLEEPAIATVTLVKKNARAQTAFYKCPNGYRLVGDQKRICRLGKWNGKQPICVPYDLRHIL